MLQWMWFGMMGASLIYACICGRGADMLAAALSGSGDAISLTLRLGAGYLLFCGLIEIMKGLDIPQKLNRLLSPLLRALMPGMDAQAGQAVTMNLSMNLLGLGNAATPLGMEAVRRLDGLRAGKPQMAHNIYMLLILNATSLQLIPTTVLALRAAAGSADAGAIVLPSLVCTAVSTAVGAVLGLICRRRREARRA